MKQLWKRLTGCAMLVALLLLLGLALPQQEAEAYVDVNQHWARDAINRWDALGALEDFTGNYFSPNQPITRAEFFSLLVRAFDAQQSANIRQFTDVPSDAWYYDIIAKANQMGIANGTSETTMAPLQNISRQDAATVLARALGISNQNLNYLAQYHDSANISDYAKTFVSAMTQYGYMEGSDTGFFYPRNSMSRAEAVTMVNNVLTHYYRPEVGFDSFAVSGNVMTVRTDSVFNDLTINGDLLICDGVDDGVVALNNCMINGRVLIRGGGADSVVLNNTYVRDGIVVINYSYDTHIVTTGSTEAQTLTAYSGFHLDGTGVHNVVVSDEAAANANITLTGVILDSMEVGGLSAKVKMNNGRITNLLFTGDAAGATFEISTEAYVAYFTTVAPNVTVTGKGRVGHAFINAPGANLATAPDTYTISANLTAIIDKEVVSGSSLDTNNNVARGNSYLAVTRDWADIGGDGIVINTTQGRTTNTVLVTQKAYSTIPLDYVDGRDGYFIGFFIPSPVGSNRDYIPLVTYTTSDGKVTVLKDAPLTQRDNAYGLEFFIPVTKDAVRNRGRLDETLYIEWNSYISENILFHSGWLDLEPLTNSEEQTLVNHFYDAYFRGLDGTRYYEEEALCRLLASDNPLGLDVSGFKAFDWEDQMDIATILYQFVNEFTSKQNIQDRLDQVLAGKGALYAVNSALTVPQMRNALENRIFAKELDIDVSASGAYGKLSENGKERVARLMLLNRKKDYANEKAVKTAFDKYVSETKALETTLLVQINTAVSPEAIQKLIETKKNYELLDFDPTNDPYKSYTKPLKFGLSQLIYDLRPYESLDEVIEIIRNYLANTDPDSGDPRDDADVTTFAITPSTLVLARNQDFDMTVTVSTPTGTHHDANFVDWDFDKNKMDTEIAWPEVIDNGDGTGRLIIHAGSKTGTTTITFRSTQNEKKTTTVKVTVTEPVYATGITLDKHYLEIEQGGWGPLTATLIPSNSTDVISWFSDNPSIATVVTPGRVTGISPGFVWVTVRASHSASEAGVTDSALVAVLGHEPGIMIYPEEETIGIGQILQMYAAVSPLDSSRIVTWATSNVDIATVDASGRVTGIAPGVVEITATSATGLTATAIIHVDENAKSIVLNKTDLTLYPNGKERLTYTITPGYGDEEVVWQVLQGAQYVDVDQDGMVTAGTQGNVSATVAVSLRNQPSVYAVCTVKILDGVPTITVNPTMELAVGESKTIDVTFNPSNINRTVHWTSEREDIATVDANGRVTAADSIDKPSETIRLTGIPEANTDIELRVNLTVTQVPITQFSVAQKEIEIDEGSDELISKLLDITIQPNHASKRVNWTVSGPEYLNVYAIAEDADEYGGQRLQGIKTTWDWYAAPTEADPARMEYRSEPVTLIGTVNDGIKLHTVEILVHIRENSSFLRNIKIDQTQWVYLVGNKQRLDVKYNVIGRDTDGTWLTDPEQPSTLSLDWEVEREDIAKIEGQELIFLAPGETTVTVDAGNGVKDTMTFIVVEQAITGIDFSPTSTYYTNTKPVDDPTVNPIAASYFRYLIMEKGETRTDIAAALTPASNIPLRWSSYIWDYLGNTDSIGNATGPDNRHIRLNTQDGSSITALESGLVRVTAEPEQPYGGMTTTIVELYGLYGGTPEFDEILQLNGIRMDAGEYYGPNERDLYYAPAGVVATVDYARPINQTQRIYLKVPHRLTESDKSFFIWVTRPDLEKVTLDYRWILDDYDSDDDILEVTATIASTLAAITDDTTNFAWQIDDSKLTIISTDFNLAAGTMTLQMKAISGQTGTAAVSVSVKSDYEVGLRTLVGAAVYEQVKDSKTVTDSINISINYADRNSTAAPLTTPATLQIDPPVEPEVTPPVIETPPIVVPDPEPEPEGNPYLNEDWYIPNPGETTGNSGGSTDNNTYDPGYNPGDSSDTGTTDSGSTTTTPDVPTPVEPEQPQVVAPTPPAASSSASVRLGGSSAALIALARERGIPTSAATYESYDTSVALVDSSGIVTGVGSGSTTVVARYNGQEAAVSISVEYGGVAASESKTLKFRSSSAGVAVGDSITLQAYLASSGYSFSDISWSSSKPEVATVQRGVVTGLSEGKTTITASVEGTKLRATCTVTVAASPKAPVVGISLNNTSLALDEGKTSTLKVTFAPASPTWKGLNWFSLDASVATVDSSGKVTAVAAGATTIIVVSDDGGYAAACTVVVSRVPVKVSKITLSEKSVTLNVGGTATLTYTITPENADNQAVTWTSSKEDVATVVNGQITALKPGTTTITVTTADGSKRATCKITVKK